MTAFVTRCYAARRAAQLAPFAAILLLCTTMPGQGLTLRDTLAGWFCSSESERLDLVALLTVVASDGRPDLGEEFFFDCLDRAEVSYSKRINEIVAGCRLMETYVFTESG